MVEMNDFENALDSAIEKSEKLTDKEIAESISPKCKMKTKEVLKTFPDRNELIRFKKLCSIILADESEAEKNKKIQKNHIDLSSVIYKILFDTLSK